MSGGKGFLARWSQRKREVGTAERPPEISPSPCGEGLGDASPSPEDPSPSRVAATLSPQGGEDSPAASSAEPADPLPDIDSLTAESDITAFLREGVPEMLKKAALRRVWSLDPAIRDFASPAEYDWDYNAAGSMHGFGSAPAGGSLRQVVTQSLGGGGERSANSGKAGQHPETRESVRAAEADGASAAAPQPVAATPYGTNAEARAAESPAPAQPAAPETTSGEIAGPDVTPVRGGDGAQGSPEARPMRHGSAVPR